MKNKKIFILGMARSGFEAAKLLAADNEVLVTDMNEQDAKQVKTLKDLGVKVEIVKNPIDLIDDTFDVMVKNPGIKYNHPTVEKARKLGIKVINEVELAFGYLKPNVKIIGVTGSNGKTTTVTLIYKIMEAAGMRVHLGGNIGTPLSKFVNNIEENDYLIIEISDHQLCDMYDFKTNISVLTNIYEAHTDFHDSHEKYMQMKKRIFNNHTEDDIAIINYDNKEANKITGDIKSKKYYFSKTDKQNVYIANEAIYYHDEKVIDLIDIKLKGVHNYENIMAVISVVKLFNIDNKIIYKILHNFGGVEHRIEYVCTINGVDYYNDAKSTNCESTKTALKSFKQNTLLLLGGLDRGHSFDELTDYMTNVTYVACYGETKNRIKDYCNSIKKDCEVFDSLVQATRACHDKAREGDVVLLSPACASWDQYKAFEERGEEFKNTVYSFEEK